MEVLADCLHAAHALQRGGNLGHGGHVVLRAKRENLAPYLPIHRGHRGTPEKPEGGEIRHWESEV